MASRGPAAPALEDGARIIPLTADAISALFPLWSDLIDNAADPNVFLEPWLVARSLPLIAPDVADLLLCASEGKLVALAIICRNGQYAKLPLTHYSSHLHCHQFLATPLVRQGAEVTAAQQIAGWIDHAPEAVSFCRFTHCNGNARFLTALKAVCSRDGRRFDQVHRFDRPAIDATMPVDDYLTAHVSRHRRKKLRRAARRLADNGPVAFERLNDADAAPRWLDDFLALEDKGWKGEAGTSIRNDAAETAFFEALVPEALSRGQLCFHRLLVDGQGVAYALDLQAGSRVFCLKVAFDPAFARYSPGMQLELHCLKHYLQDDSVEAVDSCSADGNLTLTCLWGQTQPVVQVVMARRGIRYQLPLTLARALEQASSTSNRLAGHLVPKVTG